MNFFEVETKSRINITFHPNQNLIIFLIFGPRNFNCIAKIVFSKIFQLLKRR